MLMLIAIRLAAAVVADAKARLRNFRPAKSVPKPAQSSPAKPAG